MRRRNSGGSSTSCLKRCAIKLDATSSFLRAIFGIRLCTSSKWADSVRFESAAGTGHWVSRCQMAFLGSGSARTASTTGWSGSSPSSNMACLDFSC